MTFEMVRWIVTAACALVFLWLLALLIRSSIKTWGKTTPTDYELSMKAIDRVKHWTIDDAVKDIEQDGFFGIEHASAFVREFGGDPYKLAECGSNTEGILIMLETIANSRK